MKKQFKTPLMQELTMVDKDIMTTSGGAAPSQSLIPGGNGTPAGAPGRTVTDFD